MELSYKFKFKTLRPLLVALALTSLIVSEANAQSQIHDSEKLKQLRSMEGTGKWGFGAKYYYANTHFYYSGCQKNLIGQLFNPKFKEYRSDTKSVLPRRANQLGEMVIMRKSTEKEVEDITPVWKEEMLQLADRNVDLVYFLYEEDFDKKKETVKETLTHAGANAIAKNKPSILQSVFDMKSDLAAIEEEIDCIHKMGPGYEMTNTKRQLCYEEATERLDNLVTRSKNLALQAAISDWK